MDTPTPTPTLRPKASLGTRPPNIRRDGTWHEFTVRSNVPVKVVVNESDRTLRLSSSGRGGCPASSRNASVLGTDGQTLKLMGCKVGDARVRLFSQSDDTRLRTYNFRVLSPPPTPPPAVCTLRDLETLNHLDTIERDNTWTTTCQYYTFEVTQTTHVIVDLETTGSNPVLVLHSGDTTLRYLVESNANLEGSMSDVRLGRTIDPGSYTVEARVSSGSGTLHLEITSTEAVPNRGDLHQRDHIAAFQRHPSLPDTPFYNTPILQAMNAWNRALTSSWTGVAFCEGDCPGNDDHVVIPIKEGRNNDCGDPAACFTYRAVDSHLVGDEVIIEEPARHHNTRYLWTLNPRLHRQEGTFPSGERFVSVYLPTAFLHEFGHLAGLDDLTGVAYEDYIMGDQLAEETPPVTSVPTEDVKYLEQIYRHHGGSPH